MTVLAIADGASEPLGDAAPTCLEAASTPAIDGLLRSGVLLRARTIGPGLLAGTEVGVPTLLGVAPAAQPGRGLLEAAGAGITLADDEGAWRLDLPAGTMADGDVIARMDAAAASGGARVVHLGAHRCLLIGPAAWGDAAPGSHQSPRRRHDVAAGLRDVSAVLDDVAPGVGHPWGTLSHLADDVPQRLARAVRVVTRTGVVSGLARAMGCTVTAAAPSKGADVVGNAGDDDIVVVHDPRPDEAAHARDRRGKIASIERFDADVVRPIAGVLEQRGGRLIVATDHGCDPTTGAHDAAPVPVVLWAPNTPAHGRHARWIERDAASLPVVPADTLLDHQLRVAAA